MKRQGNYFFHQAASAFCFLFFFSIIKWLIKENVYFIKKHFHFSSSDYFCALAIQRRHLILQSIEKDDLPSDLKPVNALRNVK